jgi:hypothetical protein
MTSADIGKFMRDSERGLRTFPEISVTFQELPGTVVQEWAKGPREPGSDKPLIKPDWKGGRFALEATITWVEDGHPLAAQPRAPGERRVIYKRVALQYERELPSDFFNRVENWLVQMDDHYGKSRDLYASIARQMSTASVELGRAGERLKEVQKMSSDLRGLDMEVVGKKARAEAIAKMINDLRARSETDVKKDPIVKELEQVVQLRAQAVGEAEKGRRIPPPTATEAEVREAQVKLIEAKVQLAQRREAVINAAAGELLTRLTQEEATLGIDLAELAGKQGFVTERINAAQSARDDCRRRLDELSRRQSTAKPYVVVSARREAPASQ